MMPGIHGLIGGNDWEWFKPILEGDEFTYTVTLTDVVEKKARIADRVVIGYDVTEYKNQRDEVLVTFTLRALTGRRPLGTTP